MEERAPKQIMIYKLDPEVYDKFIADLDAPFVATDLEKTVQLFQRPSPFTRDCD